jgi:hypothetical protein
MSSRALRRAQRELEEKQMQEKLAQQEQDDEQEDSEEEVAPKPKAKPSLFAMLDDGDDDQEDDDDDDLEPEIEPKAEVEHDPPPKSKKSKKKKKKRGKSKGPVTDTVTNTAASSGLDEIDQALLALELTAQNSKDTTIDQQISTVSDEMKQMCAVLSIETQHLHAANEMKKLFGRAALQNTDDEARPRQRGNGQQGGIAAAIAGRNAPGQRNLASLGLRRNIFIQGKEEWPRATSGGLAMEIAEKRSDGTVEYKFVHNRTYQEVQQQFQVCVSSMDPERMIQLLHFNRKSSILY